MALKITSDCINCNICAPECPNAAISEGAIIYEIATNSCTECVGFFDKPQCVAVCPVDACVMDPENPETEEFLVKKVKSLHPDKTFAEEIISHFAKSAN